MEVILENATEISSGQRLNDIETPFRIFAGPGAGKTHWLVEHVKNVIENSTRLGPSQRVACISYTTVAAEEIQSRLGSAVAHVDVSTIHSFLYRNVVKPYLPWARDEDGNPVVDFRNVGGHAPHQPRRGTVNRWIQDVTEVGGGLWAFDNIDDILRYLRGLQWKWCAETEQWSIEDRDYPPDGPFPSSQQNLLRYKPYYWKQGIIDHEDVLYFALRILRECPELHRFLSAKYPYLFLDEFQDTNPIQTEVVRFLAQAGTVTGVIGDREQAIFEFAGAHPDDLLAFEPEGQRTYRITTNRRSTESILRVLNRIRQGGEQAFHNEEGEFDIGAVETPPTVLVGTPEEAREHVRAVTGGEFTTLTRNNLAVRRLASAELPGDEYNRIWERLYSADAYRTEWLQAVLEATHEAQSERYGQAAKIVYRGLRTKGGKLLSAVFRKSGERRLTREKLRKVSASLLPHLLLRHDTHRGMDGLEYYRDLRGIMQTILPQASMVNPTRGQFAETLQGTSYEMLFATARLESGKGSVKTMHKAKGEEYPAVLTFRGARSAGERDVTIDHILDPTACQDDERRVTYVAFSRAEKRLYICIEELSAEDERALRETGIVVERL